jgi:ABC-type phosphate transport system substrate-binding protein
MVPRAFIFAAALAGLAAFSTSHSQGQEALAVIVNRKNPVESVTMEELRKFCIADRKHWSDNTRVTVVLRDPGQAERASVLQLVYRMSESDFSRHFLQGEFTGEIQSTPKHLSTGIGVRRFVFNVPGAIGFIRATEADGSVKVIRVNGFSPGDPPYPLRLVNP